MWTHAEGHDMDTTISRGTFLKGVGLTAGAGALLASTRGASAQEGDVAYDADVIVVGTGFAGLSAALEAAEAGAKVLLVDKCEDGLAGGNSIVSEGGFGTPVDDTQESVDAYLEASLEMGQGQGDVDLLRVVAEQSCENLEWFKDHGCTFKFDYKFPAYPAVTHLLDSTYDTVQILLDAIGERGGTVAYETRLLNFHFDPATGRVNGVEVLDKDGIHCLYAKAVIVCTGGYAGGKQYLEQFVGPNGDLTVNRGRSHLTGDAIAPVLAAGGHLVNAYGPNSIHLACVLPENPGMEPATLVMSGIAVNSEGKRFVDEGPSYQAIGKATSAQPGTSAYGVWDEELMADMQEQCDKFEQGGGLVVYKADTAEELAEQMGIPADALSATIAEFNDHVGEDGATTGLEFNKSVCAKKLVAPLYGTNRLTCGCAVTFGGVGIDVRGQVTRADGSVIGGLYAAGELTGGFFNYDYIGGSSIARCVAFGRLAARSALEDMPA